MRLTPQNFFLRIKSKAAGLVATVKSGRKSRQSAKTRTARRRGTYPRWSSIQDSASPTLFPVLTFEQFFRRITFDRGLVIQSAVVPDRYYRFHWGEKIKVWEKDRPVGYLCVSTIGVKDPADEFYALYLNLVLNERATLKVANFHRLVWDQPEDIERQVIFN